jgi:chromosome segregation ATPase
VRVTVLTLLLSALILAAGPAAAQARGGDQAPPAATFDPQRADSVTPAMQSLGDEIAALGAGLRTLLGEIEARRENEPRPPGPGASDSEEAAYRAALEARQRKYEEQVRRLRELQRQVEQAQRELAEAQRKLHELQDSDLQGAQQKDAEDMRRQLESQREAIESTASALTQEAEASSANTAPHARKGATRARPTPPARGPLPDKGLPPDPE